MRSPVLFYVASLASTALAAIKPGCFEARWDSEVDYWTHKFEQSRSAPDLPFAPEYNNTFVSIRNRQRRSVVLYCTEEPPPQSVIGNQSLAIRVPVQNVAAMDGFSQHLIDMLGMSQTIARVGNYNLVTSSCVRGNIMNNRTYEEARWDQAPPVDVDVTFYVDEDRADPGQVRLRNAGANSPLQQLAYLKLVSMFYGLEEMAEAIYQQIAANYRCAAARVQDIIHEGNYPQGRHISTVQYKDGRFVASQGLWWQTLVSDAGITLVNVTGDGSVSNESLAEPTVSINTVNTGSTFAKQSWAILDTTQYIEGQSVDVPRVNQSFWMSATGADSSIYSVKEGNVFLTDKSTNRARRHNFFDRGTARPDLVIHDLISIIYPDFVPGYTTTFLRPLSDPDDSLPQRRMENTCTTPATAITGLNLTQCALPEWASGYHAAGLMPNAYGVQSEVQSEALGGGNGLSGGEIAGIVIGAVAGAAILLAVAGWMLYRKRRSAKGGDVEGEAQVVHVETKSVGSRDS